MTARCGVRVSGGGGVSGQGEVKGKGGNLKYKYRFSLCHEAKQTCLHNKQGLNLISIN